MTEHLQLRGAQKLKYITEHRNKWLPHSPRINDCICLIEFVLRCIYIEDGNRFMLSTEINNGWKPEVDIDDVKFATGSDN
jgi:hypothetical protein